MSSWIAYALAEDRSSRSRQIAVFPSPKSLLSPSLLQELGAINAIRMTGRSCGVAVRDLVLLQQHWYQARDCRDHGYTKHSQQHQCTWLERSWQRQALQGT